MNENVCLCVTDIRLKQLYKHITINIWHDSSGLGYNCLNTGYDCKNGGACDYFGRCKCPPGFGEVDCGLDTGKTAEKKENSHYYRAFTFLDG